MENFYLILALVEICLSASGIVLCKLTDWPYEKELLAILSPVLGFSVLAAMYLLNDGTILLLPR